MKFKHIYYLCCIFTFFSSTSSLSSVTKDELAKIFADSESSFSDIYIEYDWYNIPEWTIEDINKSPIQNIVFPKNGVRSFKLYIDMGDLEPNQNLIKNFSPDLNAPNLSFSNWKVKLEESTIFFNKENKTFHQISTKSYDGNIGKTLNIGGYPVQVKVEQIS